MTHPTKIISDFVAQLRYEDLSEEVIDCTKLFIADYYAACYAGYTVNDKFNRAVRETLEDMGGKKESSTLFSEEKMPVMNAAFMNAVYAHGADIDDGNRKAMGHIAAHVMSAVFALAETMDVTFREILTAINVGYEVYNRVSAAVQPGLVHRGFHSTGTAGAIACGAACAKLMGMDSEQIYDTMSLSAVQAGGLLIIAESGQACKPINPANAAKAGILSAKLVSRGVKAPNYPLESKKGWFHAMSDEVDISLITDGLGKDFTICESYIKPYPSCRHTHCGIEVAAKISKEIDVRKVKSVKVYIYNNAIQIAGQIIIPKTVEDAKFSIHYSLATALVKGNFTLADLAIDNINTDVINIIDKIELIPDESMEDRKAGVRGARVVVHMEDENTYEETVMIPKGDADNPFTWKDMRNKMMDCMSDHCDEDKVKEIIERIKNVDEGKFISILDFVK